MVLGSADPEAQVRNRECDTLGVGSGHGGVLGSCIASIARRAFPSRPIGSSQPARAQAPSPNTHISSISPTLPTPYPSIHPIPSSIPHLSFFHISSSATMKTAMLLAAAGSASAAVYKTPLKKVSLSEQLVRHGRNHMRTSIV